MNPLREIVRAARPYWPGRGLMGVITAMDLGLDKLIEMIEQRFGKAAATAVLFAITIGALGWGVHSFAENLVLPIVAHGGQFIAWLKSVTPKEWLRVVYELAWGVIARDWSGLDKATPPVS